jgi:phosphatidylglycerophosphate synthase
MAGDSRVRITLLDVERVLPLKSWWALVGVLPLVRPLTLLVVNYTTITPNMITVSSILCRLVTALSFATGTREGYIIGALAYYVAYLLDCMDGAVARLRKMSSEFGRFLDHLGDLAGDFLILSVLAFTQGLLMTPMVAGMLFMHLSECYINYLAGSICRTATPYRSTFPLFNRFNNYRDWWFKRNIKSFFSFPDYTALIFLFFPLCNCPAAGLKAGFFVLLVVCLYTIISTFVSVHTGRRQFP